MPVTEPAFNLLELPSGRLDCADLNGLLLCVAAGIECHLFFGNVSKSNWSYGLTAIERSRVRRNEVYLRKGKGLTAFQPVN